VERKRIVGRVGMTHLLRQMDALNATALIVFLEEWGLPIDLRRILKKRV
jgi:hypothetical protein